MSRNFLNNTDYIDVDASLNPLGSLTICAWVRMSAGVNYGRAFVNRFSGTVGYRIFLGAGAANDKLRFKIAIGGSYYTVTPATGIADGAWHYWVGQYTEGATDLIEVFIDDMDAADASRSGAYGTYNTSADNFTIGNMPGGGSAGFPGDIAGVRVYFAALTAGQRRAVKAGRLIIPAELHAPMGYATEPDWSGNGRVLTVTGTTVADNPPVMPPFNYYDCEPYNKPTAPNKTGLEYTLPDNRLHYDMPDNRLHYTMRTED